MSTNQTTYENFRYAYGKGENPYDRGMWRNCLEAWCAPRLPRKVDFRAYAADVERGAPPVDRDGRAVPGALPPQGCCGADVEAASARQQAQQGVQMQPRAASPPGGSRAARI